MHPATLAGVEVIRGPGALICGSGAMGGVVLVRSPWPGVKGPRKGKVSVEDREGEFFAVGRDRRPGSGEVETPGYGLAHLSAGIDLKPGMEAKLCIDNLLDKNYPGSARRSYPSAPGRTFGLALSWAM